MNKDWYEEGYDRVMKDAADALGFHQNVVASVYRYFSELGLAGDYDVEKEIIWDLYYADEE